MSDPLASDATLAHPDPLNLAPVDNAAHIASELGKLRDLGVTDFAALEVGEDDPARRRTREVLLARF